LNDYYTLLAVGSTRRVLIFSVGAKTSQILKQISVPQYYESPQADTPKRLIDSMPAMAWGFGHSPVFKDRTYAELAVAWGPLVQLTTLLDVMDEKGQVFFDDGYVLLDEPQKLDASGQAKKIVGSFAVGTAEQPRLSNLNPFAQNNAFNALEQSTQETTGDNCFERLGSHVGKIFWLSESTMLVLTRQLELKVFYTAKFKLGSYDPETTKPSIDAENNTAAYFDSMEQKLATSATDSRVRSSMRLYSGQ
jgi:hypothetical protein